MIQGRGTGGGGARQSQPNGVPLSCLSLLIISMTEAAVPTSETTMVIGMSIFMAVFSPQPRLTAKSLSSFSAQRHGTHQHASVAHSADAKAVTALKNGTRFDSRKAKPTRRPVVNVQVAWDTVIAWATETRGSFRGEESRRRRGWDVDIPWKSRGDVDIPWTSRGDAAAGTAHGPSTWRPRRRRTETSPRGSDVLACNQEEAPRDDVRFNEISHYNVDLC